jgi:hypothetical protein
METFMVRVWTPEGDGWSPGVRGTATHLGSGRQVTFTEAAGLIEFITPGSSPEEPAAEATPPQATSKGHVRR